MRFVLRKNFFIASIYTKGAIKPRHKLLYRIKQKNAKFAPQNLSRVFVAKNQAPQEKLILDSLVGFIKDGQKQTNYALKDDKVYLAD